MDRRHPAAVDGSSPGCRGGDHCLLYMAPEKRQTALIDLALFGSALRGPALGDQPLTWKVGRFREGVITSAGFTLGAFGLAALRLKQGSGGDRR